MKLSTKKLMAFGVATLVMGAPLLVGAQFDVDRDRGTTALQNSTIAGIIFTVLQWLLLILTFVAVIGFVISGIMFVTAGGSDRADDARKWLTYSIIGIVVALLGYIVVRFVAETLSTTVQGR
ncbi:MAG: hypothetical protein U9O20_01435 [Patescibacteria group bacterium]|nr:hypothetical protein [Patescibacteria group bacterium]MEA2006806.1 hypothetical protein [Patescibacteria group bacterium]